MSLGVGVLGAGLGISEYYYFASQHLQRGLWDFLSSNLILLLKGVIFLMGIFGMSLIFSHRMAGPIYRLRELFNRVRLGDLTARAAWRRGDAWPEMKTDFNGMMDSLHGAMKENKAALDALLVQIHQVKNHPKIDPSLQKELEGIQAGLERLNARMETAVPSEPSRPT